MVDEVTPERSYTNNASIVVLVAFALIEVASVLGVAPSLALVFAYPVSLVVSVAHVLSSLLGVYGTLKDGRMATYFSLLTPVIETILGISFFIGIFVEANVKRARSVGIITTLWTSMMERIREIGILKAIGFTTR